MYAYLHYSGSRTIRTEEAILISLAALEEKLTPKQPARDFNLSHSIPQSEDTGMKQSNPFEHSRKRKHKISDEAPKETNQSMDDDLSKFD